MSHLWRAELPEEIRYLLDRMSGEELDLFRDRILNDPETADRVRDAENDLIDSYVRGDLPGELRGEVERRLLSAPDQQQRILFASALNHLQSKQPRAQRNYYVWGAIAASLVIAAAAGVFLQRDRSTANKVERQLELAQITLPGITVRSQAPIPIFDAPTADLIELRVPWQQFLGTDLQATVADGSGRILWKGPVRLDTARTFAEIRLPRNVLVGSAFEVALLKKDSGAALAYAYFRFR